MKLCALFLLYSVGDFTGMVWTGYHSLLTIASFWVSLLLFFLVAHAMLAARRTKQNIRKYRRMPL